MKLIFTQGLQVRYCFCIFVSTTERHNNTTMKKTNNTRRDVCRIANELSHKHGFSPAEAMRKAWKTVKLVNRLKTNDKPVTFSYIKADGTERIAAGTLNPALFLYDSKGSSRKYNPVYVRYFDVTRGNFRQFSAINLVA